MGIFLWPAGDKFQVHLKRELLKTTSKLLSLECFYSSIINESTSVNNLTYGLVADSLGKSHISSFLLVNCKLEL